MFLHIFAFCKILVQSCKILKNTVCVSKQVKQVKQNPESRTATRQNAVSPTPAD